MSFTILKLLFLNRKIKVTLRKRWERLIWQNGAKKIEVRVRERLIWEMARKSKCYKKTTEGHPTTIYSIWKKGLSPGAKKTVRIKRVAVKRAWVSTKYTIVKENFLRFATTSAALSIVSKSCRKSRQSTRKWLIRNKKTHRVHGTHIFLASQGSWVLRERNTHHAGHADWIWLL